MSPPLIKLGLLLLALIPVLIENIRTGLIKNRALGALFIVGLLAAFLGPTYGAEPLKLSSLLYWLVMAIALFGGAAIGLFTGGVAKFLMALLPWFPFQDYLIVFIVGSLLAAAIAKVKGGTALIVPPFTAAAIIVGAISALGFKIF